MAPTPDRGNHALLNPNRIPALNAKLHASHDPNAEYRNQTNLLSNVQYAYGVQGLVAAEVLSAGGSPFMQNNLAPLNLASTTQSFIGDSNNAFALQLNNSAALPQTSGAAAQNNGAAQLASIGNNAAALGPISPAVLPNETNASLPRENAFGFPAQTTGGIPNENGGTHLSGGPATIPNLPAPVLTTTPANGNENQPIPVPISVTPQTDSGGVTIIIIGNVPSGASLSAGTDEGNGNWSLTLNQLPGLTLMPPLYATGEIELTVTAISTEGGVSSSTSAVVPVIVTGVAITPTLSITPASGPENTAITLNITSALVNVDANENLSITITNVPNGAVLSVGTHNQDGSWTLTAQQLSGLTLTPPENYTGTINLNVTATSSENNTTASLSATLPVTVTGVASTPTLSVVAASGNEDTSIALNINAGLVGDVSHETLSVTITGVPVGAVLSAGTHNADGSWTLTAAQLNGLTLTPTQDFNGTIHLNVTATASDNGTSASISGTLPVTVNPIAETPTLSVQSAIGNENTAIGLNINAALANVDPNETLSVTITGVPVGAALSAGVNNHDGSWTLTVQQLAGLTITPPENYTGTINLNVTATASENGTSANISAPLQVTVDSSGSSSPPVIGVPTLMVQAAAGNENTAIALHITSALTDIGTSEVLTVTISNVPNGATLSAGVNNHDGTWTLSAAELTNLSITPPSYYTGTINLGVTATASENGTSAAVSAGLNVTVNTVVDAPTLTVQAASGNENTAIALNISTALTDVGSPETLSVNITGVPAGATLSAGTHNADGSWTLTTAQLSGLTLTPPNYFIGTFHLVVTSTASENGVNATTSGNLNVSVNGVAETPTLSVQAASGNEDHAIALSIAAALPNMDPNESLSIIISGVPSGATLSAGVNNGNGTWTLTPAQLTGLTLTPPLHYSGNIGLTVTANATEGSTSASVSANLPVTVSEIPHAPTLSVQAGVTIENAPIALNIAAGLTDNNEALSVLVSGVPLGAVLSAGQNNGNGTWSLAAADLVGLTVTPPRDYNGALALTVAAISTDSLGNCATTTLGLNVNITAVADIPSLVCLPAIGSEDSPIALTINSALTNILGSETLSIHITGVPTGATLSAGTHNSDGSWTLTQAQLAGLTLTPPAHSNADFTLSVTATATDNSDNATAMQTVSLPVTVIGIAHVPSVSALNVSGAAGAEIALSVGGALSVNAGTTESLTYVIHGVPDGFALNHGTNNGDNTWTLSTSDLTGLKLMTPGSFNGQLTLYATSVAHDSSGAVAVSTASSFQVDVGNYASGLAVNLGLDANVGGVGAGVGVDLFPVSGGLTSTALDIKEGTAAVISDAASLINLPALNGVTNLISNITINGVPSGASFNHGTNLGNGTWQFSVAQLAGLTITPPANTDGDFPLTVTAHMLLGLANITLSTPNLHIYGIATAPTLTASAGAATEEHAIVLNIGSALTNTDGTEALTYEVSGMPTGFTLNHGIANSNGTWTLAASDLSGLAINPAAGFSGTAHVTVSAVATETDGDQAVAQQTLNLNVAAIAHAPTIAALSISGNEDTSIALNLGITPHASEHISALTISGVPTGATLTYGTNEGNGMWSIDPNNIANVQLVPPTHWSGDANLTITATSQVGSTGPSVSTTETLPLHVVAVATAPTLSVSDSTGNEDAPIALHIAATGVDTGGAENVSVVLSGVPDGGEFSAGVNNGNGTWTVAESALQNLTFTAPEHFSGDVNLTATAWATEASNGSTASTHMDMHIHVLTVG